MIAKVLRSDNVAYTLSYGQNPEKGGEVFYLNETLEGQTPKEMADDWLAIANKYSPMCYHIVISMSDGDTEKIRSIDNPADRVEFERNVIDAFMCELDQRGNNVFDCPFVVAHHENTDNEHFHIAILTTTVDGRRLHDSFIKKNAVRAAAKISEEYGLEAAPRALYLEQQHQKAVGTRKEEPRPDDSNEKPESRDDQSKKRTYTRVEKDPSELKERQRRAIKAQQRKQRCKYMIEKLAQDRTTTGDNFLSRLASEGIRLYRDPYEQCLYAEIFDEDNDKTRTYSLDKELDVDLQLLQRLNVNVADKERVDKVSTKKYQELKVKVEKERKAAEAKAKTTKKSTKNVERSTGNSKTNKTTRTSRGQKGSGFLNASGGAAHGQNREHEVGGHHGSGDDLDEEWRRKSGYYGY